MVESIKHFHFYLAGHQFIVNTDCAAIQQMFEKMNLESIRVASWVLWLQYIFEIKQRPGEQMQQVNVLSQNPAHDITHAEQLLQWQIIGSMLYKQETTISRRLYKALRMERGKYGNKYVLDAGYLFRRTNHEAYRIVPQGCKMANPTLEPQWGRTLHCCKM